MEHLTDRKKHLPREHRVKKIRLSASKAVSLKLGSHVFRVGTAILLAAPAHVQGGASPWKTRSMLLRRRSRVQSTQFGVRAVALASARAFAELLPISLWRVAGNLTVRFPFIDEGQGFTAKLARFLATHDSLLCLLKRCVRRGVHPGAPIFSKLGPGPCPGPGRAAPIHRETVIFQ
jgi:hypothetical protein